MARLLDRRSPCRECGFDAAAVTPGEAMLHWQPASGWRPVDRVRRLVHVFDRLAAQLELVWAKDEPYLDALGDEQVAVPSTTGDALDELDRAASRLAEVVDRFDGEQWERAGTRIGGPITALEIVREAVHEGSHQLRACRRDLERACDRPLDEWEAAA